MSPPHLTAVRMRPGTAMITAVESIWERGGAALPVSPDLPEPALGRLLESTRPAALLEPDDRGEPRRRHLGGGEPTAPGTALVIATSGTTGAPKAVELSHAALDAAVRASLERLGCAPGDRWLLCLPLSHVAGWLVVLRARALNAPAVVHDRFDPERVLAAEADLAALVPTQLARLLEAGGPPRRLRHVLVGGGPTPRGLVRRAGEAGLAVTVSYGLTETAGGCVYDGRPLSGVEVDITPEGRIAIRGPTLMTGYRRRPELTARVLDDGWLVTPDRGRLTRDGRLHVLGRSDDVILTGGENVSGRVVAAVLRTHPRVADAAVVGRPDARWGERVVAVVVPAGDGDPSLEALREFAGGELPAHALPRQLRVVDALPRTGLGRLDRARLEDLVADD